jgi:hypothetical protein
VRETVSETDFAVMGTFVALTSLSLLAALAGWYYCLERYRPKMSNRGYRVFAYVFPPFLLLSATPLLDVVLWAAGAGFPTVGMSGTIVGLVGAILSVTFVLLDVRSATVTDPTTTPDPSGK